MAAPQVAAQIGSGTIPFTRSILSPEQRGTESLGEGLRTGLQVVVANPEDINSVEAFVTSGVWVGSTPQLLMGPSINPLPRCRNITIQHDEGVDGADVFIGPDNTVGPSGGFKLPGSTQGITTRKIDLPILHNVEVWAVSPLTPIEVHFLVY